MSKGKNKRKKQHGNQSAPNHAASASGLRADQNPKTEETYGHDGGDETDHEHQTTMTLRERIAASSLTDWLLTVFTGVLAAVAIWQFIITGAQLNVMRVDQRAWISATQLPPGFALATNAAPATKIEIKNTGKTAAINIRADFYVEIVAEGDRPHFDQATGHNVMTTGTILPDASPPFAVTRVKEDGNGKYVADPLTEAEWQLLNGGGAWAATYGSVTYMDVFNDVHWVRFCYWGGPKEGNYHSESCTAYNAIGDGRYPIRPTSRLPRAR